MMLTEAEELEYLELLEIEDRERVSPKLEAFRQPARIKGARGGRGAGAKSWSIASLLIQQNNRRPLRGCCFREVQKSLEESSFRLMCDTVERLRYPGWSVTKEYIDSPVGGHIIFRGAKDLRAAMQIKSLEAYDWFWFSEAQTASHDSLRILLPTLRKPGSEFWFEYNPEDELDPITERIWNAGRDDAILIELLPGPADNPWWTLELQKEMEEDFRRDPDEAEHVWNGQPRSQGQRAAMSRALIRQAMLRRIEPVGGVEVGVDVARFGDDTTQMYKRRGMVTIDHKELRKVDTVYVANEVWDFAGRDPSVIIKVDDTGVGGGVTDNLRNMNKDKPDDPRPKVVPINFSSASNDKNRYPDIISEMWFEFPLVDAQIPEDNELMQQLANRFYDYDSSSRKKIEPKAEFKKRYGKSPDKADALLLTYFVGSNHILSNDIRAGMAARRRQ